LLGITSFFLLATQVLRWDLTITTGLSAKNLIIYLLATVLGLRMVIARSSVTAAGQMQAAFLVQIFYAIITWLVAGLIIKYQHYDVVQSGIQLKSGLIDYYIFFLVFLFGVNSTEDAMKVIKWILVGAIFANLATIADTAGIVNLGYQERIDGRTQGSIGESNQYAAYIILFIPGMIAAAVAARKFTWRLFWLGGALVSAVALAMTASRGGLFGLLLACVIGAYMYRHLVSYSRIAGWALGGLVLLVVVLSFTHYGGLLTERVFGQTSSIDATEASSGRTEIWLNLFATMVEQPITFITGYGWEVYWSFPFRFSPHNHYFAQWFNLGLIGLFTSCYLLFSGIARARRAAVTAEPGARRQLIAFVIGGIALCGAVFFVELHDPWMYFWMYAGTVMRLVLCVQPAAATALEPARRPRSLTRQWRDSYGWTAAPGRRG
jgi:hypothetical protein